MGEITHFKRRARGSDWYVARGPKGAVVLQVAMPDSNKPVVELSYHSRVKRRGMWEGMDECHWIRHKCWMSTWSSCDHLFESILGKSREIYKVLDQQYKDVFE